MEKIVSTLEDNINAFVSKSRKIIDVCSKRFNSLESHCINIGATIKTLETQIGQLAVAVQEQSARTFPNDT